MSDLPNGRVVVPEIEEATGYSKAVSAQACGDVMRQEETCPALTVNNPGKKEGDRVQVPRAPPTERVPGSLG